MTSLPGSGSVRDGVDDLGTFDKKICFSRHFFRRIKRAEKVLEELNAKRGRRFFTKASSADQDFRIA